MHEITRRRLLASAGVGAAGIGLGGATGFLIGQETAEASGEGTGSVPFYGAHQAGIDTPAQDRLHFAAFDLVDDDPTALRELLREWSAAAAEMTRGAMIGDVNGEPPAPPDDTGETVGLLASRLTLTFGFGPSLFERRGLGLGRLRPAALREIPPLPGDELRAAESGGDLCVQACSDDPQVAFHAVRNLARIGRGTVVMRWSQLGFGRTSTTSRSQFDPAQPDGDEGRHRQHPRRGRGGDAAPRLGRWRGPDLDARRQLHGHPPHPHAARGLGPFLARRPGADDRPPQVQRRPARRWRRVRPARPRGRGGSESR